MAVTPKQISEEEIEKLAMIHCTQAEIAAWFDITPEALESRFRRSKPLREAYERGIGKGRASLRRHQWRMVEEGNSTMAIWLGKQILGQRDKSSVEIGPSVPSNQPEVNLSALSLAELNEYYRLRRKMDARVASSGAGGADKALPAAASEQVIDVTKLQ